MISDLDLKHLKRCVELAKIALKKGDEPFGSILVWGRAKSFLKIITVSLKVIKQGTRNLQSLDGLRLI